jgi:myo-inositol-1(or 4)-monophosphatase
MSTNLVKIQEYLLDLTYEVGDLLLDYHQKRGELKISDKGRDGVASQADEDAESFILERLRKDYPDYEILSEEDCFNKNLDVDTFKEKEFLWLVDPLDGTNNFVNGLPFYSVSIGLLHKGQPVVGVVYNPATGECFFASKDHGAYLIEFRVNPFKRHLIEKEVNHKQMDQCIFSPAPQYELVDHKTKFDTQLSVFKKNIIGARAVRRFGSAALELCYVANGNLDGYWEKGLRPWDLCAAAIICSESGVHMSDFDGNEFSVFGPSILAAHNPLHTKILGKI